MLLALALTSALGSAQAACPSVDELAGLSGNASVELTTVATEVLGGGKLRPGTAVVELALMGHGSEAVMAAARQALGDATQAGAACITEGKLTRVVVAMPNVGKTGQGVALSATWKEEMLAEHNRVRALHGVPALAWHDDVAAYSQAWADKGDFAHSDCYGARDPGPLGENLALGQDSAAEVVGDWYGELALYDFDKPGYSVDAGHFTALIWKDSRFLGCGQHEGLWVCNYWSGRTTMDCAVPNSKKCFADQVRPLSGP